MLMCHHVLAIRCHLSTLTHPLALTRMKQLKSWLNKKLACSNDFYQMSRYRNAKVCRFRRTQNWRHTLGTSRQAALIATQRRKRYIFCCPSCHQYLGLPELGNLAIGSPALMKSNSLSIELKSESGKGRGGDFPTGKGKHAAKGS